MSLLHLTMSGAAAYPVSAHSHPSSKAPPGTTLRLVPLHTMKTGLSAAYYHIWSRLTFYLFYQFPEVQIAAVGAGECLG